MDNPNPIYYKDLITPDNSITDLIKQLEQLIGVYEDAKSKIQSAAQQTQQSVQGVSGATEEQRKVIQLATEQSEKLVTQYRDLSSAEWKAVQTQQELTASKKEAAQVDKLIAQINSSAVGSYNRLSAQYRLNKIRLNEMSAEERKATDAGKKLEAETNAIYQEMKNLQEATGKHQLNVGNYADATKSLKQELRELTEQMAQMKLNGESNSEEYANMAARAGQLKDAMSDAQKEVTTLASDTSKLAAVSKGATAAQGGMSALTSTMALMGATSESASKAQKTLGYAIGAVSGLIAVQTALQKESALMQGISNLQTKAGAVAKNMEAAATAKATGATIANTVATKAASVAQAVFNAIANANPYVLLAVALISVVGALVAFASGTDRAAESEKAFLNSMKATREYLLSVQDLLTSSYDENIKNLQYEIELMKAQGASAKAIDEKERELYSARSQRLAYLKGLYGDYIDQLDENREKVIQLESKLQSLKTFDEGLTIEFDVNLDGKLEKGKVKDLMDRVQAQLDEYRGQVSIAVDIQDQKRDLDEREKQRQAAAARTAANNAKAARKAEREAIREAQDANAELLADAREKDLLATRRAAERKIEDLKVKLKEETNLTKKARKAIADEIVAITEKMNRDLEKIQSKYALAEFKTKQATEDAELALMEDGAEKKRRALKMAFERQEFDLLQQATSEAGATQEQINEIWKQRDLLEQKYKKDSAKLEAEIAKDALNKKKNTIQLQLDAVKQGSQEEIDLTVEKMETERQIELAQNAELAEDIRQNEADINAKWDKKILQKSREMAKKRADMLLDRQQDLAASEFDLQNKNERQKTKFALQQQAERIRSILENDKTLTDEEIKMYNNMLDKIDKEIKSLGYNNLWEVLGIGLDDKQQEALNTALDSIKSGIDSIAESWVEAADKAIESANAQVDAAQKVLDAEIEAREQGYANDVKGAQKELELAQQTQAKALKQKEKAQKAQLAIDTVTQASSLITATANIWSALGGIPIVGPALALAAIAAMWISFGAAKIKALQVAGNVGGEEQYGEGTVELLEGGSHASGNDIDLGTKKDGTRRRAEGGEFFAVINKRNSAKFRNIIPDVINAFNDGTFADRYQKANAAMSGLAVNLIGGGSTDVTKIEKDVRAIREQGDEIRYVDPSGNLVIRYKNLTRKIKS